MELYIARHGQNKDNVNGILNGHRDLPLTTLGERQAKEAAQYVQSLQLNFAAVYSSPLDRAFKTARIIAQSSQQPKPIIHPLLVERDFGVMTGLPISDIKTRCAPSIIETETVTYFLDAEGAETFPDLCKRAQLLLAELEEKHKDEIVLLVTHGDIGKMIYATYYKLPWRDVLKQFHFGNSELLRLSPNSAFLDSHLFNLEQENH